MSSPPWQWRWLLPVRCAWDPDLLAPFSTIKISAHPADASNHPAHLRVGDCWCQNFHASKHYDPGETLSRNDCGQRLSTGRYRYARASHFQPKASILFPSFFVSAHCSGFQSIEKYWNHSQIFVLRAMRFRQMFSSEPPNTLRASLIRCPVPYLQTVAAGLVS